MEYQSKQGIGPVHYGSPSKKPPRVIGIYLQADRYTTAEEIMGTGNAIEVPSPDTYNLPQLVSYLHY